MCGSSSQQNQIEATQQDFYTTLTKEATAVFGKDSQLFADLTSAFEPILAAGPNQEGFSGAEKTALNTQATEGVAQNFKDASQAVNEKLAAEGGGNTFIPSGQTSALNAGIAESAARQESSEQNQITEADYATGRSNWLAAAQGLTGASGVFNSASGITGAANQGGESAANTANQINQANNSWITAVSGLAGGIAGGLAANPAVFGG